MVGRARRGARRGRARGRRRRGLGRRAAARARRHRRRGHAAAAGEALERHRVGARRRLAARAARRRRRRVGGGVRLGAGGRVHDRQALVAAPVRARRVRPHGAGDAPARLARLAADRRVRHRPRRRVGHRATGRRPPARTAPTCWRSSTASSTGPRCSRPVIGARARARHRRQHGRGARPRPPARRRRDLARHLRAPCSRSATRRPPTPTGAVAGFADATGRFLPLVCTLNATKVTDAVARWLGVDVAGLDALALAGAARRARRHRAPVLRRRAHAEPARRARAAHRPARRRRVATTSHAPRSRAWCAGCSTASTRSSPPACPPAAGSS